MTETTEDLTYPGGLARLFLEQPLAAASEIIVEEDQAHYLLHVLRAKPGQVVRLFNGKDGEWLARIQRTGKRDVAVRVELQTRKQAATPDIWLALAPIKKTPLDYVVQKATELGVSKIQPVITRRTIVDRVNLERMRANAIEAAEQSERLTVPEVAPVITLDKMLETWDGARHLAFCDERGDAAQAAAAFRSVSASAWAILTGPEGGFEDAERAALRSKSFTVPVSLGPRILRADTASLAALAIWQSTVGDWG